MHSVVAGLDVRLTGKSEKHVFMTCKLHAFLSVDHMRIRHCKGKCAILRTI